MEQALLTINAWMNQGLLLGGLGCFLWGMVSVLFSPCHLASIPLIVSYVAAQDHLVGERKAAVYAFVFTTGLFITIAVIGVICALLGRMLGDVGPYMSVAVGAVLVWVALDFLGLASCPMPGGMMARIQVRGIAGAFILGLAYGVLSGTCTFGFIAPILAIITLQQKFLTGVVYITLFGLGHCIPIAAAGSSAAFVRKLLASSRWSAGSIHFRKLAGLCIGALGIYFVGKPVFDMI